MANNMAAAIKDDLFDDVDAFGGAANLQDALDLPGTGKVVRSAVPVKKASGTQQQMAFDPAIRAIIAKMQQIGKELKGFILERNDLIDDMLRALVVRDHILILGPPGTGKTMLSRCFCQHIDQAYFFYWLMNRTTDPSAILGPYDIKKMEKGHFTRVTTGMLPEAHVALMDEIGKSNEPAQNIMLSILNERLFHDDGKAVPVPLRTMIGASNEDLDGDDLSAIRDRLLYRHVVKDLRDKNNRVKKRKLDIENRKNGGKYIPQTLVTMPELEALEAFVHQVDVPDKIHATLDELLNNLENSIGLHISDRRDNAVIKVLQAEAALNGRDIVTSRDLKALTYILAQREKDLSEVKKAINALVDPWKNLIDEQTKRLKDVQKDIDSRKLANGQPDPMERRTAILNNKAHLEGAIKHLSTLVNDMSLEGCDAKDVKKAESALNSANKMLQDYLAEALGYSPTVASSKSAAAIDDDNVDMPFD